MTVALPFGLPTSTGWAESDRLLIRGTATATAAGLATIEFHQLDDSERWLIEHAVISCTSTTTTALRLYENAPTPGLLLDGSREGNFDVAEWPRGLLVLPGRVLLAQWTGASPGAVATLGLQVLVYRRVG